MAYDAQPHAVTVSGDSKTKKLLERFSKAQTKRQVWEPVWQDCYDFALPQREGFNNDEVEGEERMENIFDETALVGVQEFSSRMVAGIWPALMRAVKLDPGPSVPKENVDAVTRGLEEIEDDFYDVINHSNWQQEFYEGMQEVATSTAAMLVEENDEPDNPVRFTTVPLSKLWIERDVFGGAGAVFHSPKMRFGDLKVKWPKAEFHNSQLLQKIEKEPDAETCVVVAVYRDWSIRTEEVNRMCVIVKDFTDTIYEDEFRGEGSNPWIIYGWSRAAGETYDRGPLINALPAIRTLNLTVQLVLENAELAISGMWQGDDDGVLNPDTIRLVPGVVVPKAPGSNGLQPLETPGSFDVAQLILDEMRHNVRKALYNETLGPREGTPPSATEVTERMADLARQIGAPYSRILSGLIEPMVRRVLYIRRKQGAIKIPRIGGRYITIRPTAALAKAQRYDDISNETRYYGTIGQLFGPEMLPLVAKPEEVAARLADLFQVKKEPLRTKLEVKNLMEQLKKAMAAQQQAATQTGQ